MQSLNFGEVVYLRTLLSDGEVAFIGRWLKEMQYDEDIGHSCGGTGIVGCARTGANGGRQTRHKSDDTNAANKKPKVDDKAYQEALKRIPEPKEKYDPWAVTKTPDANKKSSK